jgi:hypothetical protein
MKRALGIMETTKIALFKGRKIRKNIYNSEWWFVIVDVVEALTDSVQPNGYIKDMRRRDPELSKGWGQIATTLSIPTEGGVQKINCANTEGIFRMIQSISSPKAEPFKRWLAKVGYERVQEIEDPELATKRTRMLYKLKGYSENWIEKRMLKPYSLRRTKDGYLIFYAWKIESSAIRAYRIDRMESIKVSTKILSQDIKLNFPQEVNIWQKYSN